MNKAQAKKPPGKMNRLLAREEKRMTPPRASAGDKQAESQDTAIASLMRKLADRNGVVRQRARKELATIGKPAVPALTKGLSATAPQLRWEAAKALVQIADPRAARALVDCLEDARAGTRWVAAEALVALERGGLVPLLEALIDRSDSWRFREGAHHVLHDLARGALRGVVCPVLAALDGPDPDDVAPVFAAKALDKLQARGI